MRLVKLAIALALFASLCGCISDYLGGAPLGSPAACKDVPAGTTITVETGTYKSTVTCKG